MTTGRRVRAALGSILMLFVLLSTLAPARSTHAAGIVATVAGSFQTAIGCPDNWQPGCEKSLMGDPDGDGIYTFQAAGLPVGNYEYKVALNETWDVSYPANNVAFRISAADNVVTFFYNSLTHDVSHTVTGTHPASIDNDIFWDGLRHDSRDALYRTPDGVVRAGSSVTLRFRTFHNDVTAVTLRVYDVNASAQRLYPMTPAATDVSCYQANLENQTCDFWAVTLKYDQPDNLWYRFVVTDGTKTVYYADNTSALDGGVGSPSDQPIDNSYALMFYDPTFKAPAWARKAMIYQIFPDRFRDSSKSQTSAQGDNIKESSEPRTGDLRYDDPVIALPWGTLPEGYCRNYADANTNCPWRFDTNPSANGPEAPRGRDYFGGDLRGVTQKLDYLKDLGVSAIYFNPIFYAKSNHRYDTADYKQIDPYLGDLKDFEQLVKAAKARGIRIILDGVFNHMSSDSPDFDRYHHYAVTGACESAGIPFRSWFNFRAPAGNDPSVCAPSTPGGKDTYYDGWFGFDSIPVLKKTNPDLQRYFITGPESVSRYWLQEGAAGWRLDVMGDASFPNGYWEAFRKVVKETDPDALIIGELWQKDSTLLRDLRGDRADTTMNYRLRDAVIGLLTPQPFDAKGFADSGRILKPSEFAARLLSMREDYPDATYYSSMNLLDSHDTERLLWTLTPGAATQADKELNTTNLAVGKQRLRLASLIQMTMPGAPTVYYGDEAGMTGADDPDDRRTFPWPDTGGKPDTSLLRHYQSLAGLRRLLPSLTDGDFRVLLADDTAETVAYGRKTGSQASLVVLNRSTQARTISIPVAGYLPEGTALRAVYSTGTSGSNAAVKDGQVQVVLQPLSGLLLTTGPVDLTPPDAPTGLLMTAEGNGQIGLAWNTVAGAAGYNVYRSPLSGGGWIKANAAPVTDRTFTDSGLRNAHDYFYTVRALDNAGNESGPSDEVSGLPHYTIGWANLQWPPALQHTISVTNRTDNVYGQVWIDGVTGQPGATEGLHAQLGFGPSGSNPDGSPQWTWIDASFNGDRGNNDEFVASMLPESAGVFDYAYRYSTTNGRNWLYADLDGTGNGYSPSQAGKLTVNSSGDTTPPAVPAGLHVVSASASAIDVSWDAVTGDPTLYGYELRRSDAAGGPYRTIALVTNGTSYVDRAVAEGASYYYTVRAIDTSFNRSADSAEVPATARLRTVTLVFDVTVPPTTDGTGRSVYIAGSLSRLDGGLADWNPGGAVLTQMDSTHWRITLTGKETTQIDYKYTLGDWDHVEKDASCGEISNRQLTLTYGATGTQTVNDAVLNWRNVSPCGN